MKITVLLTACLAILWSCPFVALADAPVAETKQEAALSQIKLREIAKEGDGSVLLLEPCLKVAAQQPEETDGLTFSIEIANDSENRVTFSNPLENLYLSVLDERDQIVKLPHYASRAQYDGPIEYYKKSLRFPFKLLKAKIGERILDEDQVLDLQFVLERKQTLLLSCSLREVFNEKKEFVALPPGRYRIMVDLAIKGEKRTFRFLSSGLVSVDYKIKAKND